MNYWYSSRPNEIFLDLDSNRAAGRALSVLRVAVRSGRLRLDSVWLYSTVTAGHSHMILVLKEDMNWMTRLGWSLWLGNDRLRAAYVLQRHTEFELDHHDLLVTPQMYYRTPDAFCECKRKHKPKRVTDRCPAMIHLMSSYRSMDYFARTGSAPPKRKIRLPWGRVPLMSIREWRPSYER